MCFRPKTVWYLWGGHVQCTFFRKTRQNLQKLTNDHHTHDSTWYFMPNFIKIGEHGWVMTDVPAVLNAHVWACEVKIIDILNENIWLNYMAQYLRKFLVYVHYIFEMGTIVAWGCCRLMLTRGWMNEAFEKHVLVFFSRFIDVLSLSCEIICIKTANLILK